MAFGRAEGQCAAAVCGTYRSSADCQGKYISDLNNLKVYSMTSGTYGEFFGFTGEEVRELTEYYGCRAQAFWSQTSRNGILRSVIRKSALEMKQELRELLEGKSCEKIIGDGITYDVLDRGSVEKAPDDPSVLYTLLVMTGYLKIKRIIRMLSTAYVCEVQIPNREIRTLYAEEILDSCRNILPLSISTRFEDALLSHDSEKLQKTMREFLFRSVSVYDTAYEVFYQGLMTGLCAVMYEKY